METLIFCTFAFAIAATSLPVILILMIPSSRIKLAISIWLIAPLAIYIAVITYEAVSSVGSAFSFNNALLGFSLISAFAVLPWLFLSAIGALIGFLLKWLIAKLK